MGAIIGGIVALIAGVAHGQTATPIYWGMRQCTGGTLDRTVTVTPLDGILGFYGTNIVPSVEFTVTSSGGGAKTNLVLGNYRFTYQGITKAQTVFWPGDTNITNAADSRIQREGLTTVYQINAGALAAGTNTTLTITNGTNMVGLAPTVFGTVIAGGTISNSVVKGGLDFLNGATHLGSITGSGDLFLPSLSSPDGSGIQGLAAANIVGTVNESTFALGPDVLSQPADAIVGYTAGRFTITATDPWRFGGQRGTAALTNLDAGNGAALTNLQGTNIINTYQNVLEFPFAGTTRHRSTVWQTQITPLSSNGVLTVTGRGVVREIQFVFVDNGALPIWGNRTTNFANVLFNVAVDGEVAPSVSVPLPYLIGWTITDQLVTNLYQTALFAVMDTPFMTNAIAPTYGTFGMTLKYPMPYTNGIRVWLSGANVSGLNTGFAADTTWQDDLPATENSRTRFQVQVTSQWATNQAPTAVATASGQSLTRVSGATFDSTMIGKSLMIDAFQPDWMVASVADANHLTFMASDSATFTSQQMYVCETPTVFSRPAGKRGWVVASFGGFSSRGDPNEPSEQGLVTVYLEGNTRYKLNGETTDCSLEWAATEDYFTGDYYFGAARAAYLNGQMLNAQQELGGVISHFVRVGFNATNNSFAGYRLFKNCPISYTNGVVCAEPLIADYDRGIALRAVKITWATVYYEVP